MNPVGFELGNDSVSEGRDIPWLQDTDADGDGETDNFLTSWPFVYRDVVIVDQDNIAVDSFNLTLHSLEEPDSYAELKQMLIDVAVSAIDATDDAVYLNNDMSADIKVLDNDEGSSRLVIDSVTAPDHGFAEIMTVDYPADLDSIELIIPDVIISEIIPNQHVELYNSTYQEVDLSSVNQVLVSGSHAVKVADLAGNQTIPARGYRLLGWPEGMSMSTQSGEMLLFRDDASGLRDFTKIDDFVAWGDPRQDTLMDLAVQAGKWYGPPDGTLDIDTIQRIPGTLGDEVHSYDNHRPATPGVAINSAVKTEQIIRYTPPESFTGQATFSYTVMDDAGLTNTAEVIVTLSDNTTPWMNPNDRLDVNNDGIVDEEDAQSVLRFLNGGFRGSLPATPQVPFAPAPFVDSNGSNSVEPLDALLVVNRLNKAAQQAEGENPEDEMTVAVFGGAVSGVAAAVAAVPIYSSHDEPKNVGQTSTAEALQPANDLPYPEQVEAVFAGHDASMPTVFADEPSDLELSLDENSVDKLFA